MNHCLDRAALWITGGEYSKSLTSFLERSPQNTSKGSSKKAQADCATHPGKGSPVLFYFLVHMCTCGFVVRKAFGVHGFLPPEWHTSWCFRKWSTDNMWIPVLNAVFWLCMWLVAAMSMKKLQNPTMSFKLWFAAINKQAGVSCKFCRAEDSKSLPMGTP